MFEGIKKAIVSFLNRLNCRSTCCLIIITNDNHSDDNVGKENISEV